MSLFSRKPRTVLCAITHCDRTATTRVSFMDASSPSCGHHLVTFERRWGQIFMKGI